MQNNEIKAAPSRDKALEDFFAAWDVPERIELVPLENAAWRICAEELCSENTLPVVRASALDGIAVRSADFAEGMPDYSAWRRGNEFDRADTGDDFDDRYDAVIAIEKVRLGENGGLEYMDSEEMPAPGSGVRQAGAYVSRGCRLVEKNVPLRPVDLAALAMGGVSLVPVYKKPRVAFIPTGSELVPMGISPKRGENIDSNSIMVKNLLLKMGAEPVMLPIVRDDPEKLRQSLDMALETADVVIINAGSSKGGEDFNTSLLGEGRLICHYVAAAPGRPMALAVMEGKPVINLPGPALAAFFGMDWCVRACVDRFLHLPLQKRPRVSGVLMADIKSTPAMAMMCRINAVKTENGYEFYPKNGHRDPVPECLTSNAMYVSELGEAGRRAGETIEVELMRSEEFI